jgi:hypothetical protein
MRTRWAFLSVALILGGCEAPEIETSKQQSALKYDPPAPYATQCNCTSTHGTCSADCSSITCDSGYGDCDGDLMDGCETDLTTPINCGGCGKDCTACRTGASCVAGSCAGKTLPEGTSCHTASCSGTCAQGACSCTGGGIDMAGSNQGGGTDMSMGKPGDGKSGCDFSGGGMATAWALLLLATLALLNRRRAR